MRAPKFRTWSEKEKSFMFRLRLDETDQHLDRNYAFAYKPMIWEQFTGLLDKNKKEIYEGDIVKYLDERNYEVKEERLGCGCCGGPGLGFDTSYEDGEIVGNIHETPELLK